MKSSKRQYRIVTAPGGVYDVEARMNREGAEWSVYGYTFRTLDLAREFIKECIDCDDFKADVVEE